MIALFRGLFFVLLVLALLVCALLVVLLCFCVLWLRFWLRLVLRVLPCAGSVFVTVCVCWLVLVSCPCLLAGVVLFVRLCFPCLAGLLFGV